MNQNTMRQFASKGRTPAYVLHLDELAEHMQMIEEILSPYAKLCYAMKANPFLTGPVDSWVSRFEVCSPGEFEICERMHIKKEKIVLSGVNKEKKDIQRMVSIYKDKGIYTVESLEQLQVLHEVSLEYGVTITVLLRLTSGNQFGMDADIIQEIIRKRQTYPHIAIEGIQYYSGTQKRKIKQHISELQMLDDFCLKMEQEEQFKVKELEYGPGFFVPYFLKDQEVDHPSQLREFADLLKNMKFGGRIVLEMGRYMAAGCGYYFTQIVDQKQNGGSRYCIVDGGIHQMNYFGQTMAMKIPYVTHLQNVKGEEENWNICGSLCTVSDVIVKELPLKGAQIGDILVFHRVGAYSITEGISLFLSRDLPGVYLYSKKEGFQRIRENIPVNHLNSEK